MNNKPITAIIVGGGHRAIIYGEYSLTHPDELKVIGIADPDESRRKSAAEKFGFSEEFCFESAEELAKKGKLADVIINGTMDYKNILSQIKGYGYNGKAVIEVYRKNFENVSEIFQSYKYLVNNFSNT